MANLETLELTIRANALSASRGLEKLINSLSSLSNRVGKSVGGLRLLNAELEKLSGYSGIKLPRMNLTGMSSGRGGIAGVERETRAIRARAGVLKEFAKLPANSFRSWMYGPRPLPTMTNLMAGSAGMPSESARRSANPQWYVQPGSREWNAGIAARNAALERNAGRTFASDPNPEKLAMAAKGDIEGIREWTRDIQAVREGKTVWSGEVKRLLDHLNAGSPTQNLAGFINQTMGIGAEPKSAQDSASVFMEQMREQIPFMERAKNAIGKLKEGFGKFRENLGKILPHFNLFNRMLRIAQTMMIRMAIRALFAGMKEGFQNYYQYAKATNGAFAKEMDSVSSAWAQLKNQMGSAMAGAVSAALPAITALSNALITAFNYASQLFALLSGKSSWSKATTQVTEFGDAVNQAGGGGGGGGGMKELLADFDELNVIASESGGGGGGGAAGAAEDFADMFTEMTKFDEGLKNMVEWISDHIDMIKAAAIEIGAIILGWKISQAFEGWIGQLGKWIMGGAMIALGVTFSYNFGKDLATKDNVDGATIFEGIVGVAASVIGGFMIGGGYGAAISLTISIFAMLDGYLEGKKEMLRESRWGNLTLTKEQLESYIESLYSFPVKNEIQLMTEVVGNYKEAKNKLDEAIIKMQTSMRKVQIGIETPEELAGRVKEAIDAAIDVYNSYDDLKSIYVTIFPKSGLDETIGAEGSTGRALIENAGIEMGKILVSAAEGQMTSQQHEMTMHIAKWINDVMSGVTDYESQLEYGTETRMTLSSFTRDTAIDAFNRQKEIDQEFLDQARTTAYTLADASDLIAFKNENMIAIGTDSLGNPLTPEAIADLKREADAARAQAAKLRAEAESNAQAKLASSMETSGAEWLETLRSAYAPDFELHHINLDPMDYDWWKIQGALHSGDIEGARKKFFESLNSSIGVFADPIIVDIADYFGFTGWDVFGDNVKKMLVKQFRDDIGSKDTIAVLKEILNIDISEIFTLSGWDDMTVKERAEFATALYEVFSSEEIMEFLRGAGEEYGDEFAEAVVEAAFGTLESRLKSEKVNETLWKNGAISLEELLANYKDSFTSMISMYGLDDSVKLIKAIIDGAGKEAERSIRNWDLIAPMINTYGIETSAEMLNTSLEIFGDDASFILENWDLFSPYIDMENMRDSMYDMQFLVIQEESDINAILENWDLVAPMIEEKGFTASITTMKQLAVSYGVDIATIVKNWQFIAPDIDATNVKASARYIMKELDGIFSEKKYITVGLTTDGSTVTTNMQSSNGKTVVGLTKSMYKATGAYGIPAGDVFVANENGAELVGSINGRTSVANQQQIIDGISQGVATANSEQNALLRQQNELLREILNKENSVRLGASVALGRTVQQSLDMFSAVGGR